jgi:cell wall-associated NlpC family hydrolase
MPRLAALLLGAFLAVCALPAPARAATAADWNLPEQRAVVAAGVLPALPDGAFHGEAPLEVAQLQGSLAALAGRSGTAAVAVRGTRVTLSRFDALLVAQLGLGDVARHVRAVARTRRLRPPAWFGTEVVARYLALRTNHLAADDALELGPREEITRAEAAHSLARVLAFRGWEVADARARLGAFALPGYGPRTRAALRLAVAKIGMPYVWGGETDTASSLYGPQVHGGYDCSGFVWRVYKLSGNPAGAAIGGRTAAQMAGEVPAAARVALDAVRPGDLVFFGPARFGDPATEAGITHVGIALSPQWMIHASSQGVYVSSLEDPWRRQSFSWARRVL